MQLGKIATILCYGLFSQVLATSLVYATTQATSPDTNNPPPAVAMLANLNKPAVKVDVSKTAKIAAKTMDIKSAAKPTPEIKKPASKVVSQPVIAADATKISKKALVALNSAGAANKKIAVNNNSQDDITDQIDASPKALPEYVEFTPEELQKREQEVGQEVVAAKEKEATQAAEAEVTKQYYNDHNREIKLQKIAQALSNQMPAKLVEPTTPDPHAKEQAELKKAVIRNLVPASEAANLKQSEHEHIFGQYVNSQQDTPNKPAAKVVVAANTNDDPIFKNKQIAIDKFITQAPAHVEQAAKKQPAAPALPSEDDDKTLPDYAYLPEKAQIVAGNPYKDEFFIVGDGSPEKLKQLAEDAKHKDYIAPVVVAAREKVASENAVVGLIKKVATQVATSARFSIDPFAQPATTMMAPSKQPADKQVAVAQFAKPEHVAIKKFAFNKLAGDKHFAETMYVMPRHGVVKKLALSKPAVVKHVEVKKLAMSKPVVIKHEAVAQLAKPRVFNSTMSQKNETEEMTKLAGQLETSLDDSAPKKAAIKNGKTHAIAKRDAKPVKLVATTNKVIEKPLLVKRHLAAVKHQHETRAVKVAAKRNTVPVVRNYADLISSKSKVSAKKTLSAAKTHTAKKQVATVKKLHNQFVVKAYSSFVHEPVTRKNAIHLARRKTPVQVSQNSEDLPPPKPYREMKKASVQVSENTEQEHLPDNLPDYLPETF